MNIVLLGAPASGKGSQGAILQELYKIPHISSGNIIRQHINANTPLGVKVKSLINKGKLLDDNTTNKIMFARLKEEDCQNGFVLDGFPRTIKQAKALQKKFKIDYVFNIEVDEAIAIKRINGRRTCLKCNKVYHIANLIEEKCNVCGGELVVRDDDKLETITERFKVFRQQTEPLIEFYKLQNVIHNVNGNETIDVTTQEIVKLLRRRQGK